MGIEKEIHQKQFETEHQKAVINLVYTSNKLISQMNAVFSSFEVTRQQYNVLRILRGQYPNGATVGLVKERMLDKMSDVSRIVQRLKAKGLVDSSAGEDRRATMVTINENGLELLSNADEDVKGFAHLLRSLNDEEAQTLNLLLDKLRT